MSLTCALEFSPIDMRTWSFNRAYGLREIRMTLSSVFRRSLLLALAVGVPASATGQTAAPPNATVYIINLKDGDTVTSPFKVQFGLTGMGAACKNWPRRSASRPQ